MVLVVILVFGAAAAACWAVSFHRTAFGAAHQPDLGAAIQRELSGPSRRPPRADASVGGVGADNGPASTSVGQLEPSPRRLPAEPAGVLGWESFVVISVLFFDGTALMACRRTGPARSLKSVRLEDSDQTMVLRLGDDHRAAAALGVFEEWRKRRSRLRLRPAGVPGAIEIADAGGTRVRAPLAVA